jgi:hypothetical protein
MTKTLHIKPKLKPLDPERLARITTGAIKSLYKRGYDLPVRLVRRHNRKDEVTLPSNVARELSVVAGSEAVLCRTAEPGKLDMADVSVLDERDWYGLPILGEVVEWIKIRWDKDGFVITINKGAKAVLGEVVGRFVEYGLTDYPGKVTVKVVGTGEVSAGTNKVLTEGLWRWPELIEDCTGAWRIGFEPFMQALEDTMIQPQYAKRDPRNMQRVSDVNEIMMATADMQAELRRSEQWISQF